MIYVLDTDVFTLAELKDSQVYLRIHARVLALDPADKVVTTIITYEEQTRGWLAYAGKSRDLPHQIKAYARLKSHLAMYGRIEVVDFTLRRRGCSLAWSAASCASALRI